MASTDYGDEGIFLDEKGAGWLVFAVVMMFVAGTLNVIDGIVALARSKFFVADATYVFSDLRTWGWITLVLGALVILAAVSILSRAQWARWFGIAAAGLNAIGQLMMVQGYPFWTLAIFATDILVIYALAVYGGRRGSLA